ncbi:MAG: hypothetical protein JW967_01320 [Dehalococcoidales bacterium]|nr:hypothetical protein [Dehalococcoidales bacterium]
MFLNKRRKFNFILLVSTLVILITTLCASCVPRDDTNRRINAIVKGNVFSIAGWEFKTLIHEIKPSGIAEVTADDIETVKQYFTLSAQINALEAKRKAGQALSGTDALSAEDEATEASLRAQKDALTGLVEAILERQIRDVLTENGIYNPFCGKVRFPPANFKLATPPNLLIISPREKIERTRDILMLPDLAAGKIVSLENQIQALGVSVIIEPLGGLGATFPTFVQDDAGLEYTLKVAVEEWLHQYLTFQPVGFKYVLHSLGIKKNYDIVTINETIAGIVSDEIGAQIYEKYYGGEITVNKSAEISPPSFDFNAAMREIRITTDKLLVEGQIEEAERYMEEQRQFLATKGYYIRKLNQAYFAFHGSYADSPTSVDPIGTKLREIRNQADSIQEFLSIVKGITTAGELDELLK